MDALALLSDDDDDDGDANDDVENESAATEEPEAKRAKTSVALDFSALQRAGYSAGTSDKDEEAAAAASFQNSCKAFEELKENERPEKLVQEEEVVAEAVSTEHVELSCEKPADSVESYDPSGDELPAPVKTWEAASSILLPELISPLESAGFKAPTDIQAHAWPILAAGRDLIGVAKTGSGKTLAFLLPCFAKILADAKEQSKTKSKVGDLDAQFQKAEEEYSPDILVLAPSRELVSQIELEANKFLATTSIVTAPCYGGSNRAVQLSTLRRRPQCVVATPGRLNDYLRTESSWMTVDRNKFLILDEADRMLDDGFEPQIRGITGSAASSTRQGMLFSATFASNVSILASWVLRNPIEVRVGTGDALKANIDIDQQIEFCKNAGDKEGCVKSILRRHFGKGIEKGGGKDGKGKGKSKGKDAKGSKSDSKGKERVKRKAEEACADLTRGAGKVLIFCGDAETCDDLSKTLWKSCHLPSETLHSGKHQAERENSLNRFHNGDPPILFATSVAGRGLDVKNVSLVVNFDAPPGAEDYVHRIGRTARAGKKGIAITLLSTVTDGDAMFYISDVMKRTGLHVPANLAEQIALRKGRALNPLERMQGAPQ
eukprot:TRINITY_DN15423_c0_g1_i1.p1 TRINITY_DN15423_c0_g1~~TRINITY_DN15423_c0_g1_i1.p1  ORF type:complete len:616 (-),score=145.14 TRINITY_DN15423_c0_g1_i1:90-1904(-)